MPKTPLERARADLALASKLLGEILAASACGDEAEGRRVARAEQFCSLCLALCFTLERAEELERTEGLGRAEGPGPAAQVEAWFRAAAPSLERAVPCVEGAARALERALELPWPAWQQHWARSCERRSALAAFLTLCRRAGLDALAARVDTSALDERLRSPREHEGRAAITRPPYDAPASHWWWAVRSAPASPRER